MSSVFLQACRKEKTAYTPIWLMRQIGRYMPEYQKVREKVSFLELCKSPDLVTEVTVTAVNILNVDAAIIFADILLITEPLGFQLTFEKGGGPKIHNPFRSEKDIAQLRKPNSKETLSYVGKAISQTVAALNGKMPVIGFAGAPFTVASYVIEGGSSKTKTFEQTKHLMRHDKKAWDALMTAIAQATIDYLQMQIDAGAQALQLFDSWIGRLTPEEYKTYALPYSKKIFAALPKNIPTIYFGTETSPFLGDFANAGSTVVGVDHNIPLDQAWDKIGDRAIQGNLNPQTIHEPISILEKETKKILSLANGRPGHIFNVGHGLTPTTPVDHVKRLVEMVHEFSARP